MCVGRPLAAQIRRHGASLRSLLDVIKRVRIEGEPQQVFEVIETDLRARLA
jgi:hypothetical protein